MTAPWKIEVTVTNAVGETKTILTQFLDNYEELVAYQEALAQGIFAMAKEAVVLRKNINKDREVTE